MKGEKRLYSNDCRPVFPSFSPNRRTKILIHGFGDNEAQSYMYAELRRGKFQYLILYLRARTE